MNGRLIGRVAVFTIGLATLALWAPLSWAIRCDQVLSAQPYVPVTAIPGSVLRDSAQSELVIRAWRTMERRRVQQPSLGLKGLYQRASESVEEVLSEIATSALEPAYGPENPLLAAGETARLISQRVRGIRNAVFLEEGVLVVVPLVRRVAGGHYEPVVVKGHKSLDSSDILELAIAAWAMKSQVPKVKKGTLILVPTVETGREPRQVVHPVNDLRGHFPLIEALHERFLRVASSVDELRGIRVRRDTTLANTRWGSPVEDMLEQVGDLSDVPSPPESEVLARLEALGYSTKEDLADLDLNGDEFIRVCAYSGLSPRDLRNMVVEAKATVNGEVAVKNPFDLPLSVDERYLVHYDFENTDEGTFQLGVAIEDLRSGEVPEVEFIWTGSLDRPEDFEDALAALFERISGDERLSNGRYHITTYSPAERTLIWRTLGVVSRRPNDFSDSQKTSPYYRSFGSSRGLLFTNEGFFRRFPQFDVDFVMDHVGRHWDLYRTIQNLAIPGRSDSLKDVVEHLPAGELEIHYPRGEDGLYAILRAREFFQTGEEGLRERSNGYNRWDVLGNVQVARAIREIHDEAPPDEYVWNAASEGRLDKVEYAADSVEYLENMRRLSRLVQALIGMKITEMDEADYLELLEITNTADYRNRRQAIKDESKMSYEDLRYKLELEKAKFVDERREKIWALLLKVNPRLGEEEYRRSSLDISRALIWLLNANIQYPVPTQIQRLYMYESMMERIGSRQPSPEWRSGSFEERLQVPPEWEGHLEDFVFNKGPDRIPTTLRGSIGPKDVGQMWRGIYYSYVFGPDSE